MTIAIIRSRRNRPLSIVQTPFRFVNSPAVFLASCVLGIGAILVVGLAESSLTATPLIAAFYLIVGTLILVTEFRNARSALTILRLFWITFGFRIFVAALFHFWLVHKYSVPYWQWGWDGGDERLFYEDAWGVASLWLSGRPHAILGDEALPWYQLGNPAWLHLLGFTRFMGTVFGQDTIFNAVIVSCFFSALLVPYVYLLACRILGMKTARIAALVAFWLPDYWHFGSTLLRDAMISCVVTMVFYHLAEFVYGDRRNWRWIVALVLNILVIRYLRLELSVVILGWGVFLVALGLSASPSRFILFFLSIAISVSLLSLFVPTLRGVVADQVTFFIDPARLDYRINVQSIRSLMIADSDSVGARLLQLGILARLPLLIGHMLLGIPFWGSINENGIMPRSLVESFSNLIWLGLVVFLPAGVRSCMRTNFRYTIWIWGSALVFAAALSFATVIIPRWRLMLMPFLVILVAQGIAVRHEEKRLIVLSMAGVIWLYILYVSLKLIYI